MIDGAVDHWRQWHPLIEGNQEWLLFETLLTHFREQCFLKRRGRARTASTHVLAAVRALNRLECLGETVRFALTALTQAAPSWLRAWAPSDWLERYGPRMMEYRLPDGLEARTALAETIGRDGALLRYQIAADDAPAAVRDLPSLALLRRVWQQQ
jgi:hypothetical protein